MSYIEPNVLQRVSEYFDSLLWKGINLYFDVLGIPRVAVTDLPDSAEPDERPRRR